MTPDGRDAPLSRADERLLLGLRRRSVREERRLFLAEGVRVAEELVASTLAIEFALVGPGVPDSERGRSLLASLHDRCDVRLAGEDQVRRLAATDTPQGVILVARVPDTGWTDVDTGTGTLALALDAVQDPGNFGTLVRSAHAFGVDFVIAMSGTVDPWNPKSVRAAAGSSFHVPIVGARTDEALAWLKERGFTILATAAGGRPAGGSARPERLALVVGNEGAGIGPEVVSAAEAVVSVPQKGRAESLNVAVAAGILLYLFTREG